MDKRKNVIEKDCDNRIVELMNKKGITYRQLEQLSGVQYPTIHKIANKSFDGARFGTLKAIAHGLGVSVSELFLPENDEQ